jgi:hypothetical protein
MREGYATEHCKDGCSQTTRHKLTWDAREQSRANVKVKFVCDRCDHEKVRVIEQVKFRNLLRRTNVRE